MRHAMMIPVASLSLLFAARAANAALWDANFTALCERVRTTSIAHNTSLGNRTTYVCGQDYAKHTLPADYITVDLETCLAFNPGWEKSKIETPTQWAGPLVGFLIPSLGFIISIPRPWNVSVSSANVSTFWAIATFFALVFDTLIGVGLVFGWAGPFIAGAMHEVFVDRAILNRIDRIMADPDHPNRRPTESERFALAITLVGSFDVSATEGQNHNQNQLTFAEKVKTELEQQRKAYIFLKQICTQLVPFHVQVGIPLVFYVSAYIYSLVDAQARLGDNDTAHSIAFGLWYYTIVLVAITSSMILSIGASRVIESVMAEHNMTRNGYKLKWMCERRVELWRWSQERIRNPQGAMVRLDGRYSHIFDEHYAKRSCVSAILVLLVPWALAFTVAYLTPEIGVSCRSATVLAYACSQVFLVVLWFIHSSPTARQARDNARDRNLQWTKYLTLWAVTALYYMVGIIALCVTLGGTIMQLTGVYRNCVCKAGLYWGLPTTRDRSMAMVKLSTDTQRDRDTASVWLAIGGTGVAWLVILCACAAWYRIKMRQRCLRLIELLN